MKNDKNNDNKNNMSGEERWKTRRNNAHQNRNMRVYFYIFKIDTDAGSNRN